MIAMLTNFVKLFVKTDPLQLLGCLFIASIVIKYIIPFLAAFYRLFLRPGKNLKRYGSYALITGATDGIGKAYAYELASKGINIILVSRTQSKLTETSNELSTKYPNIQIKTIQIDFSQFDSAAQFTLKNSIQGLDIGILINNVGQSYDYPEYFHNLDVKTVQSLIDLNIKSTTIVTHIVLPLMVEKCRGAIINISSFAGLVTSPLLSEYSAAKAYIDRFSTGLNAEYKHKGISVQTQNALFVSTKLAKIRSSSLTVPSPKGYAKAGVRCIGYEAQVIPFWAHTLQTAIVKLLPESIITFQALRMHLGLRARALKKKSQQEKSQ